MILGLQPISPKKYPKKWLTTHKQWYIMGSEPKRKAVNTMARNKKSGDENKALKVIVLVTAILNLVKALVDLITSLTG